MFRRSKTGFLTPQEMISALDRVPHRFSTKRGQSIGFRISFSRDFRLRHQPVTGVGNLSRPIPSRIARNNSRGTATSASHVQQTEKQKRFVRRLASAF